MIREVEVHRLLDNPSVITARLNPDLNIFTGRNGAGKTSLLKLLWYVISGNIEHAVTEVPFERLSITTDEYKINISKSNRHDIVVIFERNGKKIRLEDNDDPEEFSDATNDANRLVSQHGNSLFFPTFRRIEGGFSLGGSVPTSARLRSHPWAAQGVERDRDEIVSGLASLAKRLTVRKHVFVAAISTADIVTLLMRNYTELAEQSNQLQRSVSETIISNIKSFKRESVSSSSASAESALDEIRLLIEDMEKKRDDLMAPLTAVQKLVDTIFTHAGIKMNSRLSFGDAANAISSEMLSAGEKQMLSFICYNAFHTNSTIFIDEPELSLHVDWQRQLFPTLQAQGTSNQFIIATHSPFIYSKYPDREIQLNSDRGDEIVNID